MSPAFNSSKLREAVLISSECIPWLRTIPIRLYHSLHLRSRTIWLPSFYLNVQSCFFLYGYHKLCWVFYCLFICFFARMRMKMCNKRRFEFWASWERWTLTNIPKRLCSWLKKRWLSLKNSKALFHTSLALKNITRFEHAKKILSVSVFLSSYLLLVLLFLLHY